MVDLIVAQRAYEFNSKTIQTSDSMLGTATNLKR
jgi:flagellar basal-body rod protein FlgG